MITENTASWRGLTCKNELSSVSMTSRDTVEWACPWFVFVSVGVKPWSDMQVQFNSKRWNGLLCNKLLCLGRSHRIHGSREGGNLVTRCLFQEVAVRWQLIIVWIRYDLDIPLPRFFSPRDKNISSGNGGINPVLCLSGLSSSHHKTVVIGKLRTSTAGRETFKKGVSPNWENKEKVDAHRRDAGRSAELDDARFVVNY